MIIGHLFQRQYLEKAAKMRKIPHAFLFSGPEKIGKKKIALEFAKTLIGFENSFDLALVEPEEGLIQISKIRDLRSWFYLSSQSFKVVIIDNAHCMNSEAQSSLLKTLEEPRGKVVFILITSFPKILLPTIISRVEVLNFYKTPDSEIKKYVQNQGIDQSVAAKITVLSKGKAGLALDFLSDTITTFNFTWKEKTNLSFESSGEYRLYWRKQAGTIADQISAKFILPTVVDPYGLEPLSLTNEGILVYNTNLARDYSSRIFW